MQTDRIVTIPNALSFLRLLGVPLFLWLVLGPHADGWAVALLIVSGATDWLDGKIARERGEVSSFGRFMDAVIDKVLVIGLMIALVNGDYFLGHNITAMMLLLCILCREFAISGLRMAAAVKGEVVEADTGGKVKTFVQMNAIGWLIGSRMLADDHPGMFAGDDRSWVTTVRAIGMALFFLSAVLTVTSGISYFRRHGHVLFR